MHDDIKLVEKYERNGWPSLDRPDLKPPAGWSLSLSAGVDRVRSHRLSPDGTQIAFIWDRADLSDVYVMPSAGGWPGRVSTGRGLVAYWSDETPQWSPDGRWLAFCMDDHVHVVPAAGGVPRKISDFAPSAWGPVWLADSNRLIVSVTRDDRDQLVITDRDGSFPRPLVTGPGDSWAPVPSPDGTQVAFVRRHLDDLNRHDSMLVDVATGATHMLMGAAGEKQRDAAWSPDGTTLAFISERSGWAELWLVRPDGTGVRRLSKLNCELFAPAWSPDGTRLACVVNLAGAYALAVINAQDGDVRYLRQIRGIHAAPQWTPDGEHLVVAFESPLMPPDLLAWTRRAGPPPSLPSPIRRPWPPTRWSCPNGSAIQVMTDWRFRPTFIVRPSPTVRRCSIPTAARPRNMATSGTFWPSTSWPRATPGWPPTIGAAPAMASNSSTPTSLTGAEATCRTVSTARTIWPAWTGLTRRVSASYGGSYGGYLTACALSRDPDYRFACGIAKYGDMQLISSWAQCNRHLRLYVEGFLGHPATHGQVYVDGSPIHQVADVQKPVLILHGLEDTVVAPEASEEWVHALRKHDKIFEYKTYAIEPHGFLHRATQLDAWRRMERFLDWYLMVG